MTVARAILGAYLDSAAAIVSANPGMEPDPTVLGPILGMAAVAAHRVRIEIRRIRVREQQPDEGSWREAALQAGDALDVLGA